MSRTRWERKNDMVEYFESLPRGPTSLILRNLTALGSGRIFHSQVRRRHHVQVFSLALRIAGLLVSNA